MRWRLYIEEYSPDLRYIKGKENIVADTLSWLEILNAPLDEAHFTEELRSACSALDEEDMPEDAFPLSYELIGKFQSKDKHILAELKKKNLDMPSNLFKVEVKLETWSVIMEKL